MIKYKIHFDRSSYTYLQDRFKTKKKKQQKTKSKKKPSRIEIKIINS